MLQPVQTQSVTYIIQRMSALAGLFVIISALLYTTGRMNYFKTEKKSKSLLYILLAFISGLIASLSKQNAIIFPLIFLLIEVFFIRNNDGKISKTYIIAFASVLISAFILGISTFGIPAETDKITPLNYLATQMYVIPRYFGMMLVPIGLAIDHGVRIADGFFNFKVISGIFILIGIIAYGVYMLKNSPVVSFGIFWIFITLLVESSIIPITDPMFDQRMYLPLAGFAIALFGTLDFFLFSKRPNYLMPVALSILVLMSIGTIARNVVWKDRISLWTDVTEKYPDYFRGWYALGKMYKVADEKDAIKAIECFEKAKSLDPENEEVIAELAMHYLKAGQQLKAVEYYTELLDSKDKNFRIQARKVLAAYNISIKEHLTGLKYLQEVLKEKPSDEDANKSIFGYYFERLDYIKAIQAANEWIKNSPSSSEAYFYAGKIYFNSNDRIKAKQYFKKSLELNPNNVEAMLLYANSCLNTFDYDEAISYLEKAYSVTNDKSILGNIQMIKQLKSQQKK
jgi:cytochrome c-type biogenesis protein CcmH/NrfG